MTLMNFIDALLLPQIKITLLCKTKKINDKSKLMIPNTWTKNISVFTNE